MVSKTVIPIVSLPLTLQYTQLDEIPGIVQRLHSHFKTGATKPLEWRRAQLRALDRMLMENQTVFEEALHKDLKRVN